MNIYRLLSILFVLFCSCNTPLPTLEGIDRHAWARDVDACGEARRSMAAAIESEKEKLLSLNQLQIVKLLGRPDENELSSRNEKYFYYYLDPGPGCETPSAKPRRLTIRFNAVGLAREILVQ